MPPDCGTGQQIGPRSGYTRDDADQARPRFGLFKRRKMKAGTQA